MSDYEKAMADRAARIDALRKKIAGALPEELIGGFSLNGLTLHGLPQIVDGEIGELLDALREADMRARLAELGVAEKS